MARTRKRSSKAANLTGRIVQVQNGSIDRKPDSPVCIIMNKKIRKLTASENGRLELEAQSLSRLAGGTVRPEDLMQ